MSRFPLLPLAATLALLTTPALSQSPAPPDRACQPGARLDYPISASIQIMALPVDMAASTLIAALPAADDPAQDPADTEELRQFWADITAGEQENQAEQLAALEAMPAARRDMLLLAALDRRLWGTRPAINLTTGTDPRFAQLYLQALDRHGLEAPADQLRAAIAAFGPETDLSRRYARWSDGGGTILDIALDDRLLAIEARLAPLRPQLMQAAERIARDDPALLAELTTTGAEIDEFTRLEWTVGQIMGCAGNWYETVDRQDPFAALPQPQHDLAVLEVYMDEVMNGGTHQFFSNSSGGLAPEVHDVLTRANLPGHAAELKAAMDLLGNPYPRDRAARGAVMDSFNAAQDEALNAATGTMDDGQVYQAMLKIARESGLMAE